MTSSFLQRLILPRIAPASSDLPGDSSRIEGLIRKLTGSLRPVGRSWVGRFIIRLRRLGATCSGRVWLRHATPKATTATGEHTKRRGGALPGKSCVAHGKPGWGKMPSMMNRLEQQLFRISRMVAVLVRWSLPLASAQHCIVGPRGLRLSSCLALLLTSQKDVHSLSKALIPRHIRLKRHPNDHSLTSDHLHVRGTPAWAAAPDFAVAPAARRLPTRAERGGSMASGDMATCGASHETIGLSPP